MILQLLSGLKSRVDSDDPGDSLAIGLTSPTTGSPTVKDVVPDLSFDSLLSLSYVTGVMYQLCGIFSVSVFRA
jgi:hypothetical protein